MVLNLNDFGFELFYQQNSMSYFGLANHLATH